VAEAGAPLLEVAGLTSTSKFSDISFTVHAGEIVGLAGLVGAGRTEVVRAIAGADKYDSGTVEVAAKNLKSGDIQGAIRAGVGHIPEDRKGQALVLDGTVNENLGYATLAATSKLGWRTARGKSAARVKSRKSCASAWLILTSPSATCRAVTNRRLSLAAGCWRIPRCCCWMNPPAASMSAQR